MIVRPGPVDIPANVERANIGGRIVLCATFEADVSAQVPAVSEARSCIAAWTRAAMSG